ncbi:MULTISPECIES: alpha/beta hydrolase [unclassified Microbacterium]|uniref:alpha/beta hydrolase n=1 Tax=unclassified Microbacterium TaxID=2609290 RepID=UPI0012FA5C5F|nr:alpha/beta hydrolase [Microbacterium sp. MAH-37]MVQ41390.1 alpha/beta hydrolase fold domain-containing protein [Microbacterium sp. MAH-37]
MPLGYVLPLALIVITTVLALIRIRRWGNVLFAVALPADEIPHILFVYLLLISLLAWDEGDLSGGPGTVLLVIAVLVGVALLVLLASALRARPVIDAMVREHGAEPPARRPFWWLRPLILPLPWRPRSVIRTGPIFYGDDRRQRLDVYRPRRSDAPGPVLVYFHGGGYFSGSNRWEARALLYRLSAQGWTCISATYRLRPQYGFDEHLADARAALTWAHENADIHGGDTDVVVMAGSSAGGHLTALCALSQDRSDPGHPRVDAAVSLYAFYGRYYGRGPDEAQPSTALAMDASKAPPFFLVHGDRDCYVPVEDARALHRHLEEGSQQEIWYAELPGGQHGFDAMQSWRFTAVIDGVEAFLARVVVARRATVR